MNLYSTPGLDLFQLCKDTKTEQRKDKTRNAMPVEQCSVGVAAEGSNFWTYSEDTKEENMKLFCANRTGIMWLFVAAPQEPGTHKWSIISPVVGQPAAQVISLERVVFVFFLQFSSCSTVCVHEHPCRIRGGCMFSVSWGCFFSRLSSCTGQKYKLDRGHSKKTGPRRFLVSEVSRRVF